MQAAGVQLLPLLSIVCDLIKDCQNTPSAVELIPYLERYYPAYGYLAR